MTEPDLDERWGIGKTQIVYEVPGKPQRKLDERLLVYRREVTFEEIVESYLDSDYEAAAHDHRASLMDQVPELYGFGDDDYPMSSLTERAADAIYNWLTDNCDDDCHEQ